MFIIELLTSNIIENIPTKIHEYTGYFVGYIISESNTLSVYPILFSIGIIIGVSNKSIVEGVLAILLFEIIQIIIFFSIGLLYLGNHYDYSNLFHNSINYIMIPFIVMVISMFIGFFAIKKQPKHLIQLSNF